MTVKIWALVTLNHVVHTQKCKHKKKIAIWLNTSHVQAYIQWRISTPMIGVFFRGLVCWKKIIYRKINYNFCSGTCQSHKEYKVHSYQVTVCERESNWTRVFTKKKVIKRSQWLPGHQMPQDAASPFHMRLTRSHTMEKGVYGQEGQHLQQSIVSIIIECIA